MQNIVYKENIKNFRKPFFIIAYAEEFVFLILFFLILLKEDNLGVKILIAIFFVIPLLLRILQIGPQLIPWYKLKIHEQEIEIKLYFWQFITRVKWVLNLDKIDNIEIIDINDAKFTDLTYLFKWPLQNKRDVERIIMGNGPAIRISTKENKEFIFSTDNPNEVKQLIDSLILK